MKVASSEELGSLRYEAQRQAATEVVSGEVTRLAVQGMGMVHTLHRVEETIRLAHRQGYACTSQAEILEALAREARAWAERAEAAGTLLRESA